MDLALALLAWPKEEERERLQRPGRVPPACTAAMDDDNSGCCSGSVVVDAGDSPPARQSSWCEVERGMLGDGMGWEWGFNHWDAGEGDGLGAYDEGEGVVVQGVEGVEEERRKVKAEVVEREDDDDEGNVVWHWDWESDHNPLQQQQQGSLSLNLSLNYQEVLDAWSGRGSLWADYRCSDADAGNGNHHHHHHHCSQLDYHALEEVPTMVDDKEEKEKRRARVMKYREKRHARLFSNKIRYEVRRLNAEKRPRLKGRFVKTNQEKMPIR